MLHIVGEPGPSWGQNEVPQRAGVCGQQKSMPEAGRNPGKHKERVITQELPHIQLRSCVHRAATWTRTPTPGAPGQPASGGFRVGPSTRLLWLPQVSRSSQSWTDLCSAVTCHKGLLGSCCCYLAEVLSHGKVTNGRWTRLVVGPSRALWGV